MPWLTTFLLNKMYAKDRIQVINFNNRVWLGNKFDWSKRRTIRAMKKFSYANGKDIGSALYTAISNQLSSLKRRAVILITDGSVQQNSFAKYNARQVINYAKIHFIPVYIISIKQPHHTLSKIATETGGAIIRPSEINKLRKLYTTIKTKEDYRYVLVYSSYKIAAFKGMWADVKIQVNHKGQKGVEHSGYFIPAK